MHSAFNYTTFARKFNIRFPILNYVFSQVFLWVMAHLFLFFITTLLFKILNQSHGYELPINFFPKVFPAILVGVFNGVAFAFIDYSFDRRYFAKQSLGSIIILKGISFFIFSVFLLTVIRSFIYEPLNNLVFDADNVRMTGFGWKYLFQLFIGYNFFIALIIAFINQVNKKYGPGILIPLLLGKYRIPKEENRIFLFMDLRSSTSIAETLGHIKYSSFIRDCFMDVNQVVSKSYAEIYQYVGDEIVITWPAEEGLQSISCINFFFNCEAQFKTRDSYYLNMYSISPDFKAGAHIGNVTAVEIGEIKRDIAYHGDTLNTASRIQSVCNEFNKKFLISKVLSAQFNPSNLYQITSLGMISLKGKNNPIEIMSVDLNK